MWFRHRLHPGIELQAKHKLDDVSRTSQELRQTVALLERLLVCEPTLALELPHLRLGHAAVDALTLLARVLDATAALEHPDLHVLGALQGTSLQQIGLLYAHVQTDQEPYAGHVCNFCMSGTLQCGIRMAHIASMRLRPDNAHA